MNARRIAPTSARLTPLAGALLLASCAAPQQGIIPAPLFSKPELAQQSIAETPRNGRVQPPTQVSETPPIPEPTRSSSVKPVAEPDKGGATDTTLMFDQLPLPNFIQVVFGSILKKNFSLDPALIGRTDLVTLRTATPQTPAQVLETTRMLLKTYGIAVTELGGFYRIAPDANLNAYAPEIRRGRAQPEVPLPLRPVYELVELTAVRYSDVSGWLKSMFGNKLNLQEDAARNALLLSGQPADITAALEAIQVLDQPSMRARSSRLVTPGALAADELAKKLQEVLTAEGYAVAQGATAAPISLVAIPASNSLLVFAVDPGVLKHVIDWASKLDAQDNNNRRSGSYFSYTARYTDAQSLAKTMQDLLTTNSQPVNPNAIGTAPKAPARIVVNGATNTLIFTGAQNDSEQLLGILKDLDQPAKTALIEVTVAEVTLSDANQLGVEWGFNQSVSGGSVQGGTLGGTNMGSGGISINFVNNVGVVRTKLNALASANRANILSTPRVMARNGEIATIQVGSQVPVITSQQSTASTVVSTGSNATPATGILQTVQYMNTGVILKVKPVIYAGNRIDLDVSQEVSSAAATLTGVTSSPTISTRKLETKLSVRDGATVLLGGLMSENDTDNDAGVPLLKDIPLLGQAFRSNQRTKTKTELLLLITPYVVGDDAVAEQVTNAFRNRLGTWAQDRPMSEGAQVKLVAQPPAPAPQPAPQPEAPVLAPAPASPSVAPGAQALTPATNQQEAPGDPSRAPAQAAPGIDAGPAGKTITDAALLQELQRAASSPTPVTTPGVAPVPKAQPAVVPPAAAASAVRRTKKPVPPPKAASQAQSTQ